MNPNYSQQGQGSIGGYSGTAILPDPPQASLPERLMSFVNRLEGMSEQAFITAQRFGILQPTPTTASATSAPRETHTVALLNYLEVAVSNLERDLGRIRSFAG